MLPVDGIHPKGIVSDAFGTGEVPIESMLDLSPFPGAVSRTTTLLLPVPYVNARR